MATPLVMLPGQLSTALLWAAQSGELGRGREVLVIEQRDHDTVAELARATLAAAPPRFALAAHAMGGFVAFEMLRQAPERIERLALLSTLAPGDTPVQTARREGYLRLVEGGNFPQVVEERIPIVLSPRAARDRGLVAQVRRMAADTGPQSFLRQQRAIMSRPDSRPSLGAIRCPVIILFARQDGIVTLAHQEEMRDAIPSARLAIIEECGHMMTLERPGAVTGLLAAWLAG